MGVFGENVLSRLILMCIHFGYIFCTSIKSLKKNLKLDV